MEKVVAFLSFVSIFNHFILASCGTFVNCVTIDAKTHLQLMRDSFQHMEEKRKYEGREKEKREYFG